MERPANPWSVPVAVEDIPEIGMHRSLGAPAAARADIARLAGLRELPRLSAEFDLTRRGAGVRVSGRVHARVAQVCVVSLEPIENEVQETVDLLFLPPAEAAGSLAITPDAEVPETLVDGKVDLGAVATEFLMLGIDPYPRKPGVEFSAPQADEPADHPFAALEALKKRLGGGPA